MSKRIDPATTANARSLRSGMTDAERRLWQALRHQQLSNHRFRRQFPIGRFIADFVCIERKIVLELDGGQHQDRVAYDEQRTAYLMENGWRVLRFWNNDVLSNLDGVLSTISDHLETLPPP
jgi:very-short-patch-repair endonuclease